jgi:signal transduction histidine kinase
LKKNNRLIAGTGTGLDRIRFHAKDTIIENLAIRNNIFSPFHFLCLQRDSSALALTGTGELYQLRDDTVLSKSFLPSPFFRNIKVNNESADTLHTFSHNKNNFFFSVSAPAFWDNKNTKYAFSLTENGRHWEQHTTSADFTIANLQAGSYEMKVTVHYPGKIYPDQELTYSFIINKPFWKQWWFVSLVILTIGLTGFYLIRNYYRRQLEKQRMAAEKQQAIEKERTRIATDMHDDFGANLSRVKFISEKMQIKKADDDTLKMDLSKISSYSDEMAQKMNEIVWALNRQYDSLGDLVAFCRSYASEYLTAHNIHLNFTGTDLTDRKIQGEIRRNIFLVIKESLHNIVKHANAAEATIIFELKDGLLVTISDNGKGIDINNIRPFANGVENIKKRIASINGSINFKNNNGTIISITVPL